MSKSVSAMTISALTCVMLSIVASAQTSPPADQSAVQANQAIAVRKAVYTLIGNNFGPLGQVVQGKAPFDGTEALKRAERVAFLAGLAQETYSDISKIGNTKAKPEIWENRAEFDKLNKEFADHSNALVAVLRKDKNNAEAFKAAATAVAGDCKSCHDQFRAK